MDNSTYVSLSVARSLERSLDLSANNIANSNTAGYKAERTDFEGLVRPRLGANGKEDVSFADNASQHMDPRPGPVTRTGNPLDVAITGDGWFSYTTARGQTAFGRDGQLALDAQGNLVTTTGARVLDQGGAPIAIPQGAGTVSIAGDGTMTDAKGVVLGKIGVFTVPGIETYQRIGAGMMIAPASGAAAPQPAQHVSLRQGFLEQSNIQPVLEMTRMISIQRAYERAMQLMQSDDTLRSDVLTKLGQS